MAESLDYMATELEKAVADGKEFDERRAELLTEIITDHGAVVFNGDGYSEEWQIEAAKRGLPNLQDHDGRAAGADQPSAMELFEKYGVFTHRELHSRYEVAPRAVRPEHRGRGPVDAGDRHDSDPAGGHALPDRAGPERRRAEGGWRGSAAEVHAASQRG